MSRKNGIHIVGIDVSNFARLKVAQVKIDPEAGLVRVTGKNRAGKTSLLRAIQAALGGAAAVPTEPIHEGAEDQSFTKLTLSNGWAIERRFTPATKKGYLTVVSPDGGKYGQSKLDEWVGPLSFSPLAAPFEDRKKMRELLLSLATDPDLGVKLDQLAERRQELYEERTQYIVQKRDGNKVPQPEGERPAPVDVGADAARLEELQESRRDWESTVLKQHEAIRFHEAKLAEYEEGIRQLEERLAKARRMRDEQQGMVDAARKTLAVLQAEDLQATDEEIKTLRARLAQANEISATLERWRRYDAAQEALAAATEREAELTALIKECDAEKDRLLAEAGIPVEGITFDPETGDPLLNGRPYDAWSGAERIHVATSLALAANPELRICLLDEANDMDLESLKALDALAKEHDFMIFACRIGLEGAGEIVVEDGVAREGVPA